MAASVVMEESSAYLFALLRSAMNGEPFEGELEAEKWKSVFLQAQKQSLMGVRDICNLLDTVGKLFGTL